MCKLIAARGLILGALAVVLAAIAAVSPTARAQVAPVSDDFHSTTLNTGLWTYVNPRGDSTLTMNGTNAVISVPGGINHELWTNTTTAPRLMQTIGNVDFQVETKFDLGMAFQAHGSQEEGIMAEQDGQNFIRFALFSNPTSDYVYVAIFAAGQPTQVTFAAISLGNNQVPVWIRVLRSGNNWTLSWSADGSTYTTLSTFSYALTISQIGPYVGNAGDQNGPAPAFTASIDYFFNTASPINPEDGGADLTPTSISAVPSQTGATVSWTTADWSNSQVNYGPTPSYGTAVSNPALVLSHSLNLSGLTCATTYHYQVTSSAPYGGASASSTDATFTTNSCGTGSGPTISNIVVTPGSISATVAWTTNVSATSRVDYGLTVSYGTNNTNSTLVTSHSVSLTGLTCATLYHYKITSVDGSGNSSSTTDSTFTTTACTTDGPVSDDFHSTTLNTGLWTYVNPRGDSTLTMNGTNAVISVPGGINHELWTNTTTAPRLMQTIGNVDFQVETKFDLGMAFQAHGSQEEGIMAEQDGQNFIRFALFSNPTSDYVYVAIFAAGQPTQVTFAAISLGNNQVPVWIRVLRSGNNWTLSWSADGSTYTTLSTFSYALTISQIGPYVGNAGDQNGPAPAFTASIDYFFNTASPINPEDGGADLTPTSISAVPSQTGATVSWTTADWSNSQVNYGPTPSYGTAVSNPALVLSHSLNLSGLTCATTYHYQVTSSAPYGGASASSTDATFTTNSCGTGSGPTISNIVVTPGSISATVAWTTNVSATSRVDYGLTVSYGTNNTNSTLVTSHSVSLTGLTCATLYHYKITSVDGSGNSSSTTDSTFTTTACTTDGPVSDDFHSTTLNTGLWTYVNPRGDSTLTMNGTNAVISVPGGINHELWTNTTTAPRLMQTIGNVDFQVETKFDLGMAFQAHGSQEEGIMAEQDGQNFIRFALFSNPTSDYVYVAIFAAGQPTQVTFAAISLGNNQVPVWIRVLRSGNNWTLSWSADGSTYTTLSTFSYALTISQIGPYVGNAGDQNGPAPAFTASIDYFFNTASPINPEDGGADLTPTSISAVPSQTGATVSWTTADWSNSQVNYGPTPSYGTAVSNPALVLSHSLNLSGLTCATTYHYQVTSSAPYGGASASSTDATFTTNSCGTGSGPTISNIVVTPGSISATVAWTTNVSATSRVDYGLTVSYGTNNTNSTLVTSHSVSLTGLTCATLYHYKITSVDGSGNSSSTTDSTFTTTACTTGGPVSDDFHSTTLNTSLWTFVNPCCGFLQMSGTDALLIVPSVTNHDPWVTGDGTVRLMQSTANVDFEVVAKFDSSVANLLPTNEDQEEGIIVEQDSNTFLRFDIHTGANLFSAAISNGVAVSGTVKNVSLSIGTGPFWMRITRTGDSWTQSWSVDGVNFNVGNVITFHMTASRLGPFGGNAGDLSAGTPAPSFTAAVDYFFNTASPISPTDGGMPAPPNQPVFNVWYGDNQTFGQNGIAQQWVNILGNVSAPSGIQSAFYTLNGGAQQFLRVGPNRARLVDTGDFNVEIDHASLRAGANTVVISATDNQSHTTTHTVTLNWNYPGGVWKLPYSIDWSTVTNIQSVAQIVDGQWAIQPDGSVRTLQVGYDRLIALGDVTWTDYQVTAEITLNSLDCDQYSLGVVVGWQGHTTDPNAPQPDQPRSGHPFFGYGSYATTGTNTAPNAELNIYANSPNFPETVLIQDNSGLKLSLGVKYDMKFAVQRNANNTSSEYYLKIWPATSTEPANWNLVVQGDASTGSILLAAVQADVSFGKITVVSLP